MIPAGSAVCNKKTDLYGPAYCPMEQVQDCANGEIAFQSHETTVPLRVLIASLTVVGRYPGPMTRLA